MNKEQFIYMEDAILSVVCAIGDYRLSENDLYRLNFISPVTLEDLERKGYITLYGDSLTLWTLTPKGLELYNVLISVTKLSCYE